MVVKYVLTLRPTSPPHLYLDQLKEIIKGDEVLTPQMRKCLEIMKQHKKAYIQLPLQMEVMIETSEGINIERGLKPVLLPYSLSRWLESDKTYYKNNPIQFMNNVIDVYKKMGYEVAEYTCDDKLFEQILQQFPKA